MSINLTYSIYINIGSDNGLVPTRSALLFEPMLTLFYIAIWRHQVTMSSKFEIMSVDIAVVSNKYDKSYQK